MDAFTEKELVDLLKSMAASLKGIQVSLSSTNERLDEISEAVKELGSIELEGDEGEEEESKKEG